jgi:hypothetical protein
MGGIRHKALERHAKPREDLEKEEERHPSHFPSELRAIHTYRHWGQGKAQLFYFNNCFQSTCYVAGTTGALGTEGSKWIREHFLSYNHTQTELSQSKAGAVYRRPTMCWILE